MSKIQKNRYGVEYSFEPISEGVFEFKMDPKEMQYCRCGGKPNQEGIDFNDLGFFDPPGGPWISIGQPIEGKNVVKISSVEGKILLTVV